MMKLKMLLNIIMTYLQVKSNIACNYKKSLTLSMDYLAILLFVITSCGTPGPNNIMVMTSGINHGFRKTIPHVVGINIGFPLMIVLVGFGFNKIFQQFPIVYNLLQIVSVIYLLYIAYNMLGSNMAKSNKTDNKPFGFVQAAIFQWINPKAWIMAIGALAAFTSVNAEFEYLTQTLIIASMFIIFGAPCTTFWLYSGSKLKNILSKPIYLTIFNSTMALLLVLSLAPVYKEFYLMINAYFS